MKVYIAAPWVRREDAKAFGEVITAAGFTVTSHWFHHQGDSTDSTGAAMIQEEVRRQAREDIFDVCSSDAVVVLNLEKSEGKAVETGIALNNGIPVISVGKRSNIFQSLCIEVDTPQGALDELRALQKTYQSF
jgi:nucleoside 2-deoxyribosyltransferase